MEGLESFFTSGQQFYLFIISCLLGIPVGIFFDIFRLIRIMIPHNKIAVAVEDIVFFCFYGIFLMCFTVAAARSEFRFFYCIGNFLGFVVYYLTIGSAVTLIMKKVVMFIRKVFIRIFRPVIKKIALICEKLCGFFVGSLQNIKIGKKNSKIPLIDDTNLLYNKNESKKDKRKNVKKIGNSKIQKNKKEKYVQSD